MFQAALRDLVKDSWLNLLQELKESGGLPVSELSRRLEVSYMGMKDQCEALVKLGYLERWRVPRKEVGRPEILYRLAAKAEGAFPVPGAAVVLEVLEGARLLFGETAPERILVQYFERQRDRWLPKLGKAKSLVEKATMLAGLREKEGYFCRCRYDAERGFRVEEYHHPLRGVLEKYPSAVMFEVRMMEEILGTRVTRRVVPGGKAGPSRVEYEVATLGVKEERMI